MKARCLKCRHEVSVLPWQSVRDRYEQQTLPWGPLKRVVCPRCGFAAITNWGRLPFWARCWLILASWRDRFRIWHAWPAPVGGDWEDD